MPTGTSDGTVLLASADARYRQFPFHCSDWPEYYKAAA